MFSGNFAPRGWALCNGQLLPISQNAALFSIIGTNFGGNGSTTFGLPNLQSRVPMHMGTGAGTTVTLAQTGGAETVTLDGPTAATTLAEYAQTRHATRLIVGSAKRRGWRGRSPGQIREGSAG